MYNYCVCILYSFVEYIPCTDFSNLCYYIIMDRRKFLINSIYAGLALGFAAGTGFYFKNMNSPGIYDTFCDYYEGEYIPNLDIHLVEHCNLNCKYCCHFSNIAEPEFYSPEEYEKDLKQLRKVTDGRVANILLMGGEPLLNPKINEFMMLSRKYFPRTYIQILTNGLLLKSMPDSFWQTMSDYKILLRHSVYPAFKVEDYTYCDKKINII